MDGGVLFFRHTLRKAHCLFQLRWVFLPSTTVTVALKNEILNSPEIKNLL